jgi:hypothetical protein
MKRSPVTLDLSGKRAVGDQRSAISQKAESCPLERLAEGAILLQAAASGFRRSYGEPDAS